MANLYNELAERMASYSTINSMYHIFKTVEMRGPFDSTWPEQQEIMQEVLACTRMLIATMEGSLDFVEDETDSLCNFISLKLRNVIHNEPQKEKDIQEALENLLIGRGLDKGTEYDRETGKFNFSGREYIPDFIIPKLNLCIEVKLLKDSTRKSKCIEEINADSVAYLKAFSQIIFVIYDIGIIRDLEEFKRDIESTQGIKVLIVKH